MKTSDTKSFHKPLNLGETPKELKAQIAQLLELSIRHPHKVLKDKPDFSGLRIWAEKVLSDFEVHLLE